MKIFNINVPNVDNSNIDVVKFNGKTYKFNNNDNESTMKSDALSNLEWNDIFNMVCSGEIYHLYSIGASKDIILKSGEKVIMQFAHYIDNHAIFISKDCLETPVQMVSYYDNFSGNINDTIAYKYLNNQIFNLLPDDLYDIIIKSSIDKPHLILPSEYNIFGEYIFSDNSIEDYQWDIFKDPKNRIKRLSNDGAVCDWWESSPFVSYSTSFCIVNTSGAADGHGASYSLGVPLCFIM